MIGDYHLMESSDSSSDSSCDDTSSSVSNSDVKLSLNLSNTDDTESKTETPDLSDTVAQFSLLNAMRDFLGSFIRNTELPMQEVEVSIEEAEEKRFECPICLESKKCSIQVTIPSCQDVACRPCLAEYLESKIMSGQVMTMHCHNCGGQELTDSFIEEHVSERHFKKMLAFRQMKLDRNARMCPKCEHVQCGNKSKREMKCEECGVEYCFLHSDAHPNTSCKQFEKNAKKETKRDRKAVKRESVACPGCSAPVYKDSGCNHMTCSVCETAFCWLCGRKVSKNVYPTHYKWWNIFGCPKLQMREGLSPNIKCKLFFWRLLFFLGLFIGVPLLVVLVLLLIVLFVILWPITLILLLPITIYRLRHDDRKGRGIRRLCCPVISCLNHEWSDF
eukprot:TRINITY_DN975_c0_g1_i1.p1 TRINITY_DN975_c0_g1~~TRINITY_DN975_c0_g1_i1.p1  ORF type:complete len:389 (+),score=63.64 TRINITY_DN975_c0_g1_i1:108-1274(+)